MKKTTLLSVLLASACLVTSAHADLATQIKWYKYPCSLPDVTVREFGTARDNLLTGMAMGGMLDTYSRMNRPSGVEIRGVFDSTDITVSTNLLWKAVFNPAGAYASQHGQRQYCPVLAIGIDGTLTLSRLQYRVVCGVGLLSNQSSLAGLNYSVSRIGIQKGTDGILFTPDDVFIKSGPGTTEVDAIVFIGGRIAAAVNQASDYDDLNAEIGDGTYVTFGYEFVMPTGTITDSTKTMLYKSGGIPSSYYRVTPFSGPKGWQFSVVGPSGVTPFTLQWSRKIAGPWHEVTTAATEGTSVFIPATGTDTDMGFVNFPTYVTQIVQTALTRVESTRHKLVVRHPIVVRVADELAQDCL
jgi:hypothetical protein